MSTGEPGEGGGAPEVDTRPPSPPVTAASSSSSHEQPDGPLASIESPVAVTTAEDPVRIELADFEGPLDLLLHLVKKHELDILNIPIAFITDRYLVYIKSLAGLNLDVAGEYLLMAATLAHLKSRELLPPSAEELAAEQQLADDEDLGDPREELIRRLLEYQKYKEAALHLGSRPVVGRNVWLRGLSAHDVAGMSVADTQQMAPLQEVPVFKLIEALEKVLSRARVKLTHDVVVDRISISERINQLVERLERENTFTFASCFDFLADEAATGVRHQVVITFLALLEMTKGKMIRLHQPADRGDIYITHGGGELRPFVSEQDDDLPPPKPSKEDSADVDDEEQPA